MANTNGTSLLTWCSSMALRTTESEISTYRCALTLPFRAFTSMSVETPSSNMCTFVDDKWRRTISTSLPGTNNCAMLKFKDELASILIGQICYNWYFLYNMSIDMYMIINKTDISVSREGCILDNHNTPIWTNFHYLCWAFHILILHLHDPVVNQALKESRMEIEKSVTLKTTFSISKQERSCTLSWIEREKGKAQPESGKT